MAKKPAPKNEKSTAAQTSMLPAEGRTIRPVPLTEIQPDPRQPRTDDDKKAANVANICETLIVEEGVARPIHPIQVRKTPPWADDQKREKMIFDGECRYLAATIKGATAILCDEIEIAEEHVHERQVLTAMAREPLGPAAQLEAIRRFDDAHRDVNAENAAVRLGIQKAAIRSLRKVNALPADVRLRFMGGEHTLEVCDSIARIEGVTTEERVERQSQASKAVCGMAPKKAREYIASQFLLRLATAPFDREDVSLNPEAGACSACPHRTGAQTALFGETDQGEDCCTRPACWISKSNAALAKIAPPALPDEDAKPKAKTKPCAPTKDDVLIAAALAGGNEPEALDGMFSTKTREEIDAALERLAAHGNPKARPALLDRQAKGKDLGGYSRGSTYAIAVAALDAVRDALARLLDTDRITFLMDVSGIVGADVMRDADMALAANSVACEPGGEPPPPPPVTEALQSAEEVLRAAEDADEEDYDEPEIDDEVEP